VYVANYGSGTVSVIDTSNHTVTATIAVGPNPIGVAVHPTGTSVYVTNYGGASVAVIDTGTNTVTTSVPVGANPVGVALTADGARALVANYTDGTVSILDTSSNGIVATATAGQGAAAFGSFVGTPGTAGGGCAAALPLGCDDGNMCTVDSCDVVSGCLHTAIAGCCRADLDCDDGDSCTTDTCNPDQGCTHDPVGGMTTVSCRLAGLNETLGTAVEEQLGGDGTRHRLERLLTKADQNVSAPASSGHGKALQRAVNQLAKFVRVVRAKARRRTIDESLAERLIDLASDAIDQLKLLRSGAAQHAPHGARAS
jgi:YVTN family beta-propeller protein